jgi:hypothetical protein
MNLYKKISSLGWKQTKPVKIGYDSSTTKSLVVDDIYEDIYKYGKKITIKKKFLKHEKFFYNKIVNFEIWLKIVKDEIQFLIIKNENEVEQIFTFQRINIKSKQDIINLLPKSAKREIILNHIFK